MQHEERHRERGGEKGGGGEKSPSKTANDTEGCSCYLMHLHLHDSTQVSGANVVLLKLSPTPTGKTV